MCNLTLTKNPHLQLDHEPALLLVLGLGGWQVMKKIKILECATNSIGEPDYLVTFLTHHKENISQLAKLYTK